MKKIFLVLMALTLAACGSQKTTGVGSDATRSTAGATVSAQQILAQIDTAAYRPAEVIVKFKAGVPSSAISAAHGAAGATLIKKLSGGTNVQHMKISSGLTVKDAVAMYLANPNVEFAEPNYLHMVHATLPNDEYFNPQQWALNNTGAFAYGLAGADIKAPATWDILTGNSGMVIAVLDTGIDYTHPDLVTNLWTNPLENPNNGLDDDSNGLIDDWRGWNFVWEDKNGNGICDRHPEDPDKDENCHDPLDDFGHGTHVSGIIGATGNNRVGISGVMWSARIMPLKVCDAEGLCSVTAINDAISYAVSKGVRVINMSLGGSVFSALEQDAISFANAAGALVIASAGNEQNNNDIGVVFPAGLPLPNIISVAATDQWDRRSDFSNFGVSTVHVAAPGTYILSTVPLYPIAFVDSLFPSMCTGSAAAGYDFCNGTSMAAPHVSGLAGLLMTTYPHFTHAQVRATILRYVDVLPALSGIMTSGRINMFKAVSSLLTPAGLAATASGDQIHLTWSDRATGEDGYYVERRTGSGSFSQIAALGPDSTSYADTGLASGTEYTYRVRAFNTIPAESAYSEEASATTAGSSDLPSNSGNGGGGGGCSIGSRQNGPTAAADALVMMVPLFTLIGLMGLRRRKK